MDFPKNKLSRLIESRRQKDLSVTYNGTETSGNVENKLSRPVALTAGPADMPNT